MVLSCIALGEFAEGFTDKDDPVFQQIIRAVEVLEIDADTSWLYGQTARRMRREGTLIGSNDLWIGCSALRHELPLVTRNGAHFRRIQGLQVMEY